MLGKPGIQTVTSNVWMVWTLALCFVMLGEAVVAAEESAESEYPVSVPSVRTKAVSMSALAAPGAGTYDPAAQNAGVNPANIANTSETFTVAWVTGGTSKSATVGQVPDTLYAATEDVQEGDAAVRKAKIKFTAINQKNPVATYKVICTPPIRSYFMGVIPIPDISYCLGTCQPANGTGGWTPFDLDATHTISGGRHNFHLTHETTALPGRMVTTTIVTVMITSPHGNPAIPPPTTPPDGGPAPSDHDTANSSNELVFTDTFPDPANNIHPVCTVVCTALATMHADKLRWRIIDPTDAFPPVWHYAGEDGTTVKDEVGQGSTAKAMYNGLFARNTHFGKRKVELTIDLPGLIGVEQAKDEAEIEIFFPRDAVNHPGNVNEPADARTPNWFYYWASNAGGPLKHRNDRQISKENGINIRWGFGFDAVYQGQTRMSKGGKAASIFIGPNAVGSRNHRFSSPEITFKNSAGNETTYPLGNITISWRNENRESIDGVMHIIEHELNHTILRNKALIIVDNDKDTLPNVEEDRLGTNFELGRTFPSFYLRGTDAEIDCELKTGNPKTEKSKDWASPGKQKDR